jgi:predicted nucleic acid-binding protein
VILVDTSVWVDHLRERDETLAELLDQAFVLTHPFVVGELALGDLRQRAVILDALSNLPLAPVATDPEVLHCIEQNRLFGSRIGYIDAHVLAAVQLHAGTSLWTNDRRLHGVAQRLGMVTLPSRRRAGASAELMAIRASCR